MKSFVFPGGEPHVIFSEEEIVQCQGTKVDVLLRQKCTNATEWMGLLVILDSAFRYTNNVAVIIPYFPGARQDRYDDKQPGTPHTLKVYGNCLKQFPLLSTIVYDIHNPHEAHKWVPNLVNIELHELLHPAKEYTGVIRPDKGAEQRASDYAAANQLALIRANKVRDPASGQLSGFACETLPDPEGHYVIVDDIGDGCGTFIGLAKTIKEASPKVKLDLKITHGIFSKGLEEVLTLFESVYTTDSFATPELAKEYPDRLFVVDTRELCSENYKK